MDTHYKVTVAFHKFANMLNNGTRYTLPTLYSQSHILLQLKTSKNTQPTKLLFVTLNLKWLVLNRINIDICNFNRKILLILALITSFNRIGLTVGYITWIQFTEALKSTDF